MGWLLVTLALSLAVISLHLYALEHFWYWKHRWFDIPMHVLGGATVGAFFIALTDTKRPLAYLGGMFLIGAGWEVMEYTNNITSGEPGYWFDTLHDILDDAIGAIIAYVIARLTIWRSV
jgi:hypothetical protein